MMYNVCYLHKDETLDTKGSFWSLLYIGTPTVYLVTCCLEKVLLWGCPYALPTLKERISFFPTETKASSATR